MLVLNYCIPGDNDGGMTVEGMWRLKRDESDLSSQLVDSIWLHITANHQASYNGGEEYNIHSSHVFGWGSEHASIKEKEKSNNMKKQNNKKKQNHDNHTKNKADEKYNNNKNNNKKPQ